jgi:two-component system, LytTR family, sensor kinase
MKTRGITDLYLPQKIAFHVKVVLGSILATALFHIFKGTNLFSRETPSIFLLIYIQMEIFIWLGMRFFNLGPTKSSKDFLRKTIIRLVLFYMIVLALATVILTIVSLFGFIINGADLNNFFGQLVRMESKGFMVSFAGGVLIGTVVFFYFQWTDALKREQKLKEEKMIFRYETLKNQVRPHFLFNSLNTLSSLVNGNETADMFITKLSAIYRYILDNIDKDTVELEKELAFVRDYFYLQQIRDENKINLELEIFTANGLRILPISLQILVENALKHNSATRENPLHIKIDLENSNFIVVRNNLQRKTVMERSSGIGLKNLGERLKLATGKEMIISENSDQFIVKIPLTIE